MLSPEEFEAVLDQYLAGDAHLGQPQLDLLKRWSKQLRQQESCTLSEPELAETRRKMWARIQTLTTAPEEPPVAN